MQLRIAHITATFPPYHGGTGNVCFHNARELARRGQAVQVWTAAVAGAPAYEVLAGVQVHRLRPLVQVGNAPLLPGLIRGLRGCDLLHLHAPFILGAELVALISLARQIPLVVSYHNDLITTGTWRDPIFWLATQSIRHAVVRRASRNLFVSQGHAATSALRQIYQRQPARSIILPNGVDIHAFSPSASQIELKQQLGVPVQAPLIGFVSSLDRAHHYKGLEILLEALADPRLSAAYLLVVGDGELKSTYQQLAAERGLSQRVIFYGAAPQATLPPLYQACDVVAVPSLVAESFSLTMLEALACGVPVVASTGPGVQSVMVPGSDGLLAAPGSSADLARQLMALLNNPALRKAMGQHARQRVEALYSWETIGDQLEAIYADLFQQGRSLRRLNRPGVQ